MIIIVSVIAVLFTVLLGLFIFRAYFPADRISYDIADWETFQETYPFLPSVSQMGDYTELTSKHLHRDVLFLSSDTYILKAVYSEDIFDRQMEDFENNYKFQQTVIDNHGEKTIERDAFFKLDGYDFRILALEEYDISYPKQIVFVGFSSEENTIAFVSFFDKDIDYIGRPFEEFLIKECNWK